MGEGYITHGEIRCESQKERDDLKDKDVGWRIILR
jgi:hypothetical protein